MRSVSEWEWEWYTVECLEAPVRSSPSLQAQVLAILQLGNEIQAKAAHLEGGRRWLRTHRQSLVDRLDGHGPHPLSLAREGFILMEDSNSELPEELLPRYHLQIFEVAGPGQLSKTELAQLARNRSGTLPLDARHLGPAALQKLFRPEPQTQRTQNSVQRAATAISSSVESLNESLDVAVQWLAEADALLVASGDSSSAGRTWPGLQETGVDFEEACSADYFRRDPARGWEFFSFCRRAVAAQPALSPQAVQKLHRFARCLPQGGRVVTAAWDGAWEMGGWAGQVAEFHGSLCWQQCCRPETCCLDVWKVEGESEGPPGESEVEKGGEGRERSSTPTCPKCGAAARPNVQMYGMDYAFSKRRLRSQMTAYDQWLQSLEARGQSEQRELRLVCLELECGLAVPTLRREIESVMRRFQAARLIRTSTESPSTLQALSKRCVVLPFVVETSLWAIQALQHQHWRSTAANCIIWDDAGGGTEILCHSQAEVRKILQTAAKSAGASLALDQAADAVAVSADMGPGRRLTSDRRLPPWYFFEDAHPTFFSHREGKEQRPGQVRAQRAAVLRLPGRVFKGLSKRLQLRQEATRALLTELSAHLTGLEAPRAEHLRLPGPRALAERRHLLVRACAEVLPPRGLSGDESSLGCLVAAAFPTPQTRAEALPSNLASLLQLRKTENQRSLRHDDWELAPPGGHRFSIVGTWDNWKAAHDMLWDGTRKCYCFYVHLGTNAWESFQILQDGSWESILFPSCRDGGPHVPHTLCGPRKDGSHGKNWSIGMHKSDGAKHGDRYEIKLMVDEAWTPERVHWTRLAQTSHDEQDAIARGFSCEGVKARASAK